MDWDDQTVIRKKKPSAAEAKSKTVINRAMATGNYEIHKKMATGNKHAGTDLNMAKVADDTETFKVPTVNSSVSKAIQAGRQAKGLTQKDLATKISEKPQVVQEYEAGKAIPSQQILGKLERVLGIKLRGHDIGTPLEAKKQ